MLSFDCLKGFALYVSILTYFILCSNKAILGLEPILSRWFSTNWKIKVFEKKNYDKVSQFKVKIQLTINFQSPNHNIYNTWCSIILELLDFKLYLKKKTTSISNFLYFNSRNLISNFSKFHYSIFEEYYINY